MSCYSVALWHEGFYQPTKMLKQPHGIFNLHAPVTPTLKSLNADYISRMPILSHISRDLDNFQLSNHSATLPFGFPAAFHAAPSSSQRLRCVLHVSWRRSVLFPGKCSSIGS